LILRLPDFKVRGTKSETRDFRREKSLQIPEYPIEIGGTGRRGWGKGKWKAEFVKDPGCKICINIRNVRISQRDRGRVKSVKEAGVVRG